MKEAKEQPQQLQLIELPACYYTLNEIWDALARLVDRLTPEERAQVRAQIDQEFLSK